MRDVQFGITHFWERLLSRPAGPFGLRFVLQPLMAILLAIRAGRRDAREGKPPYLWTVCTDRRAREELLGNGWKDIGRVFLLAIVLDMIVQAVMFRWIYPVEALIVGVILAILPYVFVRGPVTRLCSRENRH